MKKFFSNLIFQYPKMMESVSENILICLAGDSILDNASYVKNGQSVRDHLNKLTNEKTWMCARDGSVISDVESQVKKIPEEVTHIFVSMGGNDLLGITSLVGQKTNSIGEALICLWQERLTFEKEYRKAVNNLVELKKPLCLLNIYNPNFSDKNQQLAMQSGLCLFNDVILSIACEYGLPMINIKMIFDSKEDYANHIEPSSKGGEKIAKTIYNIVMNHKFNDEKKATIYSV
jgi:hypothetical protein